MNKPSISSQPPANAPDRNEPSTFADRADAWVAWIKNSFYPFLDASNDYGELTNAAAEAAQQAVLDNTSHRGEWVSGTFYTVGDTVWSPSTGRVYRRINTVGVGTNDPADTPAYWVDTTIANVQSSPDDDTDGRILTNGAHGLGAGVIEYNGDIDDFALPTGFYRVQSGATGAKPAEFGAFNMVILRRTDGVSIGNTDQLAITEGGIWMRSGGPTTWGKWYRGWSAKSLLNSVSNDGDGEPSGGVMRRVNAGANGWYQRFADGTQIAVLNIANSNDDNTWTFGAAFSTLLHVDGTHVRDSEFGSINYSVFFYDWSTSSVSYKVIRTDGPTSPGDADVDRVTLFAYGRWD